MNERDRHIEVLKNGLRECPFCGGKAEVYEREMDRSATVYFFAGCCATDCGAESDWFQDRTDAIEWWNRRSQPQPPAIPSDAKWTEKHVRNVLDDQPTTITEVAVNLCTRIIGHYEAWMSQARQRLEAQQSTPVALTESRQPSPDGGQMADYEIVPDGTYTENLIYATTIGVSQATEPPILTLEDSDGKVTYQMDRGWRLFRPREQGEES